MAQQVKKLSLDILKPAKPGLIELTGLLSSLSGVQGVRTDLLETDRSTETIRINLEGSLDYPAIKKLIEENGGVIHSLNSVVAGKFLGE